MPYDNGLIISIISKHLMDTSKTYGDYEDSLIKLVKSFRNTNSLNSYKLYKILSINYLNKHKEIMKKFVYNYPLLKFDYDINKNSNLLYITFNFPNIDTLQEYEINNGTNHQITYYKNCFTEIYKKLLEFKNNGLYIKDDIFVSIMLECYDDCSEEEYVKCSNLMWTKDNGKVMCFPGDGATFSINIDNWKTSPYIVSVNRISYIVDVRKCLI
ncbi:MAG: hypothetical protein RLZZ546_691 [Bacteroidota bacterium]